MPCLLKAKFRSARQMTSQNQTHPLSSCRLWSISVIDNTYIDFACPCQSGTSFEICIKKKRGDIIFKKSSFATSHLLCNSRLLKYVSDNTDLSLKYYNTSIPACVLMIFSDRSAEETLTAIARCSAIMLPRSAIATYGACLWKGGIDSWTGKSQDRTTRCTCSHAHICVCNMKQVNNLFIFFLT